MNKLENGGAVPLWSGWRVNLPPACFERNVDFSWSAWGADWTLDISIVDTSGAADGKPVSALQLRGPAGTQAEIEGEGWIGLCSTSDETHDGKRVYRLSAKLCAPNTVMLCTVSFFSEDQIEFADSILASVQHIGSAQGEDN
jgi:hypothetical protein